MVLDGRPSDGAQATSLTQSPCDESPLVNTAWSSQLPSTSLCLWTMYSEWGK